MLAAVRRQTAWDAKQGETTPPATPSAAAGGASSTETADAEADSASQPRSPAAAGAAAADASKSAAETSNGQIVSWWAKWRAPPSDLNVEQLEELRMITGCKCCMVASAARKECPGTLTDYALLLFFHPYP